MGFKFKQFAIDDNLCGQKVGTDSIMLGSWSEPQHARYILDIGTGSGLLLLMQKQQALSSTKLVGIDVDPVSIEQAENNITQSGWENLQVVCEAIQNYDCQQKFDLIISNPPYFIHNKKLICEHATNRYSARHDNLLDLNQLLFSVNRFLDEQGAFRVIIPFNLYETLRDNASSYGLHAVRECTVQASYDKPVSRVMIEFKHTCKPLLSSNLVIHDCDGDYSDDYRDLCREFYLKF
jgi:tRNA1Val (adenine37-N6)-methyltransferase